MSDVERILRIVYDRVEPKEDERQRIRHAVSKMIKRIEEAAFKLNVHVKARVEGSIAKDTWISGDRDIDIFIQLPKEIGLEGLRSIGLKIAKSAAGDKWAERYAEHPYIETELDGFKIDLVPCFMLSDSREALSTVDRTPFHTNYINNSFNDQLRREVRVLKQFMKGIGVYGAEIKIQGFSGYLCELLILHYNSFMNLIGNAANRWKPFSVVIDIERYYSRINEAKSVFHAPLIVVDPVDKRRNVAAALSLDRMCEFIAACRAFLKNPSLHFFYPIEPRTFTAKELIEQFEKRGTDFVFIVTSCPEVVPDILWGQLYKSWRGLKRLLSNWNFNVIDGFVWSDEKDNVVFCFELESASIPGIEKHIGPPISSKEHCDRFLEKHLGSKNLIAGPKIEGDRWIVYLRRKYSNAIALLANEWYMAKLGNLIYKSFSNVLNILLNDQILDFYNFHRDFAISLTKYLRGKLPWLYVSSMA